VSGRGRALLAAAAAALLGGPAMAAAAPTIATDATCLRPRQFPGGVQFAPFLNLEGAGFTPGAAVVIDRGGKRFTTIPEPTEFWSAQLDVADLLTGQVPRTRAIDVVATDPVLGPSNTLRILTAPLAFSARPRQARPSATVTFRFSGFVPGRPVYAHYRYGGRVRARARMGVAAGPCGTLTARRRQIPVRDPEAGIWRIQFDQRRPFRARSYPRLEATVTVTPGR
jgi:hypothetical protein